MPLGLPSRPDPYIYQKQVYSQGLPVNPFSCRVIWPETPKVYLHQTFNSPKDLHNASIQAVGNHFLERSRVFTKTETVSL